MNMTPEQFAKLLAQYEDPRELWEQHEDTREILAELGKISTFNEDGRHFTQFLKHWQDLEEAGLVEVYRPDHESTGIRYSQEFWNIELTDEGRDVLEVLMDAGLIS